MSRFILSTRRCSFRAALRVSIVIRITSSLPGIEDCGKRQKHEFICTKCNIIYYPSNEYNKKKNKFETPDGPNKELLTAAVNEDDDDEGTPIVSTTAHFAK